MPQARIQKPFAPQKLKTEKLGWFLVQNSIFKICEKKTKKLSGFPDLWSDFLGFPSPFAS
jgi:hypothetical protein